MLASGITTGQIFSRFICKTIITEPIIVCENENTHSWYPVLSQTVLEPQNISL